MAGEIDIKVRFGDIDAAGIVFYPRYFEMLNAAVEEWFESGIGVAFRELHLERGLGVPTVALQCDFPAASRLGEVLRVSVAPTEVGRSSCKVRYVVSHAGEVRLTASAVLVCMNLKAARAEAWPEDIRAAMLTALEDAADKA